MNPLRANNRQYSMSPLMVQILNYPPKFRKSNAGIKLLGIIPGNGTQEAFNFEPYFEIVVDELMELNDCVMYVKSGEVLVNAKLVQFVLDFPALAKVLHVQGQGNQNL